MTAAPQKGPATGSGAVPGAPPTAGSAPAPGPQTIPRPVGAELGRAAPWATLPPAARRALSLAAVVEGLGRARLLLSQSESGGPPRPTLGRAGREPADAGRAMTAAAVLVPVYEEDGEARLVLTRRSEALRSHRGEVSFPGGQVDPGEHAVQAALREAEEEVGIDPTTVDVVGWLRPVLTFSSSSRIVPVVGLLPGRPALAPNPAEVARVFDVALADLVADGIFHEERWSTSGGRGRSPGGSRPVWFFDVAGETIWGATARLLVNLLCVVLGTPEASSDPSPRPP